MEDKKDPLPAQLPESTSAKDRVGEILRKERERRDISIFVIAKDLRLNPRFIEALEGNDYDQLPGDTYIRVYLRSLCKYFTLNPDEILERFFKERGLSGVDTLRKDSSTKINLVALREKEKPNKTAILAASIFIIFALLCYIAARQGWFSPEKAPSVSSVIDSTVIKNEAKDSTSGYIARTTGTVEQDSFVYDNANYNDAAMVNSANFEKDTLPEVQTIKMSVRDSIRSARAKARFIKDSILKTEAKNKVVKDSILRAEAKNKVIKDSILKAEAKIKVAKKSILKAEAKIKVVKDSIIKTEVKNNAIKDSIIKEVAKNKAIKDSVSNVEAKRKAGRDSVLKAEAKNAAIKDSMLKVDARSKTIKDSILKAEEKNRIVLEEIMKAQAKAKLLKDSILKAQAKNKAVKDSLKQKKMPAGEIAATGDRKAIALKLEVTGNSAWARVLYDGVPWRNILRKGAAHTFTAKDSLNLRTGQLEDIVLTLNGKKLVVPSSGTIALKIDHSGVTVWTDEKWFKLTKGLF